MFSAFSASSHRAPVRTGVFWQHFAIAIGFIAFFLSAQVYARDDAYRRGFGEIGGTVYTMSNAADGNAVWVYRRGTNGRLTLVDQRPTGGLGTGGGLGNQSGLALSDNGQWLFAVNAGSDELSVFRVRGTNLQFADRIASGGDRPVSVAVDDEVIYVLNAGSDNVAGFRLDYRGRLSALPESIRPLSGSGTNPAQVSFSPDGRNLVVTERASNNIVVYQVLRNGLLGAVPSVIASEGQTPFGFGFAGRRELIVSEAVGGAVDASSVSAYRLNRDGTLRVLQASVPTHETAACWVAITPDDRFAYTTNTGSSSISAFRIAESGSLEPLPNAGAVTSTGDASGPIDLAITADGRFLYTLNSRTQTLGIFRIRSNGELTSVGSVDGLPVGANGLLAQ